MARYKCEVLKLTPWLRRRTSPGLKPNNISSKKFYTGDVFYANETKTANGMVWYKNEADGLWSSSSEDGKTLLKVTQLGDNKPTTTPATNNTSAASKNTTSSNVVTPSGPTNITIDNGVNQLSGIIPDKNTTTVADTGNMGVLSSDYIKGYDIVNSMNFPRRVGSKYDYTTNMDIIHTDNNGTTGDELTQEIRENLNIYSAYSKLDINNKYHTEFNRFKLDHPDIFLRNTIGYIVFTRPDLNLLTPDGQLLDDVAVDTRVDYIAKHNMHLVKTLTHQYDGKAAHNFNPFLSNLAQSIEVMDDTVDTLDTGETFTGYKFQYSKHNIKSITAGSLNIKFKETFDLGITNIFQLWVDYQSNVYKGIFLPKEDYIWFKNIDYMCNIYYFLLDQDGETLLFWSKYFGVFPTNVPKGSLSYDAGSQVQLPDMSVNFSYIYKEDLSPATLVEFNKDAGLSDGLGATYLPTYNAKLGHSGKTWVGVPFVSSYNSNNGISPNAYGFKLRFRIPNDMKNNRSYGRSDAASTSQYINI